MLPYAQPILTASSCRFIDRLCLSMLLPHSIVGSRLIPASTADCAADDWPFRGGRTVASAASGASQMSIILARWVEALEDHERGLTGADF